MWASCFDHSASLPTCQANCLANNLNLKQLNATVLVHRNVLACCRCTRRAIVPFYTLTPKSDKDVVGPCRTRSRNVNGMPVFDVLTLFPFLDRVSPRHRFMVRIDELIARSSNMHKEFPGLGRLSFCVEERRKVKRLSGLDGRIARAVADNLNPVFELNFQALSWLGARVETNLSLRCLRYASYRRFVVNFHVFIFSMISWSTPCERARLVFSSRSFPTSKT